MYLFYYYFTTMKKGFLIFTFASVFLPFFSFANLKHTSQVEKEKGIDDTTMYTMIYTRDVDTALKQDCDASSLQKGKERFAKIQHILDKKYQRKKDARVLDYSWDLYAKLADAHKQKLPSLDDKQSCSMKYILYHTQQYLREKHLDILKKTKIIKDFDGLDVAEIYGWKTKRDLLDMKLKQLAFYKEKL